MAVCDGIANATELINRNRINIKKPTILFAITQPQLKINSMLYKFFFFNLSQKDKQLINFLILVQFNKSPGVKYFNIDNFSMIIK